MLTTRLFEVLITLDAYELNRFGKFLSSPYFNEDEQLVDLFEIISPYFKKQEAEKLKVTDIWNKIYPAKKFNTLKFARLFSDLLKKLEEFLVIDELKQDKPTKRIALTAQLAGRKLVRQYPSVASLARKELQASSHRDGEYYLQLFRLESSYNSFIELQNQRTTEKNLLQTLDALHAFYLTQKLNYLSALLHYKNFLSIDAEVKLASEVLAHLSKNDYSHIPAIDIRYKIILSMTQPEEEKHFNDLKKLLEKHYALFPQQEARNLFAFAINYCIRKINFGKTNYLQQLLLLYKQMLQAGLMTDEKGALSQFDYKNIVTVGLRAGDIKWTEKFIRDYKNNIPRNDRKNAYTFNLARIYFTQRRFDKVLPLLQDVLYNDIFYQLDSKTTLIKTYYELGEYLPLMALKESFRILLRRKKVISDQNRINYMNFLRFTMKLYRLDVKDKKKAGELKKNILSSTNVADKTWLTEKIIELSGDDIS